MTVHRTSLKNETKADAERDLRDLISAAGVDGREGASRTATAPPGIYGHRAPAGVAKYSLGLSCSVCFEDEQQTMILFDVD